MLNHACRDLYGDRLFEMLSDAKNVTLQRVESATQVLLKVYNLSCDAKRRGEEIDWSGISKKVLLTKPMCAESVPVFVKLASGSKSRGVNHGRNQLTKRGVNLEGKAGGKYGV